MDPYKVLGVSENASKSEVQQAYRKKAMRYHPDAGGDAWAFQHVQEAYEAILRKLDGGASRSQQRPASAGAKTRQASAAADQPKNGNDPSGSRQSTSKGTGPNRNRSAGKSPPAGKRHRASNAKTRKAATASGPIEQKGDVAGSPKIPYWLRHILTGQLPLQNEVAFFVLVGVLDILMTCLLLRFSAVEANPFARVLLHRWGFNGMIAFKVVSIAGVVLITQLIAQYKISAARKMLTYGTLIIGIAVAYSAALLFRSITS